jgi:uncharacterized protein (TIGR04255 family)
MNEPKTHSGNPVLIAAIEIRFESSLETDAIFATFYPILNEFFPKYNVKESTPSDPKKKPQNKYLTECLFMDDNYALSIGSNVVIFENAGIYNDWDSYFKKFNEVLELISSHLKISQILRIGVRLVHIFEEKSISDVINYQGSDLNGYEQDPHTVKTEYKKGQDRFFIQIMKKARLIKKYGSKEIVDGLYLDVDASINKDLSTKIDNSIYTTVDRLHTDLKTLLFKNLLKENAIKKFNNNI